MNWMPNKINALESTMPVAATHPKSGGKAPGTAPTKTATGPTLFNGVYRKLYNIIETTDRKVVKGLVNWCKITSPRAPRIKERIMDSLIVTFPVGKGL